MRAILLVIVLMLPATAWAMPDGNWACTYSEPPDYVATHNLRFVAGRVIIQKFDASMHLIKDAVLTDHYGFWEDPEQNEFYPDEGKLVRGEGKGQRNYICVIRP